MSFSLDDMGNKDELEKTIITKLSDDVRVSMTEDAVHINIIWRKKSKEHRLPLLRRLKKNSIIVKLK